MKFCPMLPPEQKFWRPPEHIYIYIYIQRRTQDLGLEGRYHKISSKVARISVRSGDIQQKFTQQKLKKF